MLGKRNARRGARPVRTVRAVETAAPSSRIGRASFTSRAERNARRTAAAAFAAAGLRSSTPLACATVVTGAAMALSPAILRVKELQAVLALPKSQTTSRVALTQQTRTADGWSAVSKNGGSLVHGRPRQRPFTAQSQLKCFTRALHLQGLDKSESDRMAAWLRRGSISWSHSVCRRACSGA
jgi:hypothetical protein